MTPLRFLRSCDVPGYGSYNAGEVAVFHGDLAVSLVSRGFAAPLEIAPVDVPAEVNAPIVPDLSIAETASPEIAPVATPPELSPQRGKRR